MAVVAIAAEAPASSLTSATEAPPITLSDLDGDGDLDLLVDAPLGQAQKQAVDVYANDGNRMTPLASGLAKLILRGHLRHLHPGNEPRITWQQVRQLRVQITLGQAAGQRRHSVAVVGIDIDRLFLRLAKRRIHQ